ncbi:MAG TPA: hypothetical protein VN495_00335 [Candidatus Paceibacterota bacterium]|nr:hypothetical protein [Candidatus Paceibacterota bacterium]
MNATFSKLMGNFATYLLNPAIKLLFAAGALYFVWGLVLFLKALSEGGNTKTGRDHMLWGVLGMFIMVSALGIITLLSNTFGLGVNSNGSYTPPNPSLNITVPPLGQ